MADNVQLNSGTGGAVLAADDVAGIHYQRTKVAWGVDGSAVDASASNPLPVVQTGTPALPTDAATQTTLAAMSAKLPAALGQTTMANSLSVAIASDQGNLGVTDGGTSLTVDFTGQKTSDYDSGAGTDTVLMVGLALPASGGAVQGGTSTNPVRTDPTGTTTQPVSAASLPLPTGAATAANQSTGNTSLATIAGAVSGTEMQVDVLTLPNVTLAAGTNTQEVVGDVAHDAAIAGNPITIGGRASAAAPADVSADDDAVRAWFLRNGAQATVITAAGALVGGDATNGLDVDVTRLPSGTVAGSSSLPAGTNNIGDVDVLSVPADPFGTNADAASATGSISAKLRSIAGTGIPVTSLPASTNTLEVVGDVAHDSAVGGNPLRVGARATNATLAAVANDDAVDLVADLNGKLVIMPYTVPENMLYGATSAITDTSAAAVLAAAGAGVRNYVTSLTVTNSHATVSTLVEIRDGTTTVMWRGYALAAGGGFAITFPVPLRGTANTAVNAYCITTGSNVYVSAAGYKAP